MEESTKIFDIIMKEVLTVNLPIEPTLYIDIQGERPASFCPVCGGERYRPGEVCLRCERRTP